MNVLEQASGISSGETFSTSFWLQFTIFGWQKCSVISRWNYLLVLRKTGVQFKCNVASKLPNAPDILSFRSSGIMRAQTGSNKHRGHLFFCSTLLLQQVTNAGHSGFYYFCFPILVSLLFFPYLWLVHWVHWFLWIGPELDINHTKLRKELQDNLQCKS